MEDNTKINVEKNTKINVGKNIEKGVSSVVSRVLFPLLVASTTAAVVYEHFNNFQNTDQVVNILGQGYNKGLSMYANPDDIQGYFPEGGAQGETLDGNLVTSKMLMDRNFVPYGDDVSTTDFNGDFDFRDFTDVIHNNMTQGIYPASINSDEGKFTEDVEVINRTNMTVTPPSDEVFSSITNMYDTKLSELSSTHIDISLSIEQLISLYTTDDVYKMVHDVSMMQLTSNDFFSKNLTNIQEIRISYGTGGEGNVETFSTNLGNMGTFIPNGTPLETGRSVADIRIQINETVSSEQEELKPVMGQIFEQLGRIFQVLGENPEGLGIAFTIMSAWLINYRKRNNNGNTGAFEKTCLLGLLDLLYVVNSDVSKFQNLTAPDDAGQSILLVSQVISFLSVFSFMKDFITINLNIENTTEVHVDNIEELSKDESEFRKKLKEVNEDIVKYKKEIDGESLVKQLEYDIMMNKQFKKSWNSVYSEFENIGLNRVERDLFLDIIKQSKMMNDAIVSVGNTKIVSKILSLGNGEGSKVFLADRIIDELNVKYEGEILQTSDYLKSKGIDMDCSPDCYDAQNIKNGLLRFIKYDINNINEEDYREIIDSVKKLCGYIGNELIEYVSNDSKFLEYMSAVDEKIVEIENKFGNNSGSLGSLFGNSPSRTVKRSQISEYEAPSLLDVQISQSSDYDSFGEASETVLYALSKVVSEVENNGSVGEIETALSEVMDAVERQSNTLSRSLTGDEKTIDKLAIAIADEHVDSPVRVVEDTVVAVVKNLLPDNTVSTKKIEKVVHQHMENIIRFKKIKADLENKLIKRHYDPELIAKISEQTEEQFKNEIKGIVNRSVNKCLISDKQKYLKEAKKKKRSPKKSKKAKSPKSKSPKRNSVKKSKKAKSSKSKSPKKSKKAKSPKRKSVKKSSKKSSKSKSPKKSKKAKSPKRKSPKSKSVKKSSKKSSKSKSPKKSKKAKSPKRKSPKRKSPKRKSPKRKSPKKSRRSSKSRK